MPNNHEFLPCMKRQKMTTFDQDGSKVAVFRCTEPEAKKGYQDVIPEDCQACELRKEVLRKEVERRPNKKAKDAERKPVSPGFVSCQDRLVVKQTCCGGSVREMWICDSMNSAFYQKEIGPPDCADCPARRAAEA